ncbi:N-acetyltransferase family protein [Egicoccus sp. AB-alg6-2]|uniref:GNAT family N-acetyltransferase n=1 Tax=Egicoccus sp. AB-alg6-2 TaxID=3242692 RepID=UPI00359E1851
MSRAPDHVEADEWHRRVELRDGTAVLLRQIRREDRERLAAGFAQLSPASRYLRFHSAIDALSEEQLTYLTEVDHRDHEAVVGVDLDRPDTPGVGVARYVREPFEPEVAEAAITVADPYHGQGAGTLLLGALTDRARANGIAVFRSYVLDGNHAMLEVFDHLGGIRHPENDRLWRVDLPLPDSLSELPDSAAGRAFLAAARGQRHLVSLFPPVWSRLKGRLRDRGEDTDELAEVREDVANWLEDEPG